jgi:hypothetical protein
MARVFYRNQARTVYISFKFTFKKPRGAQILGTWSSGRLNCVRLRIIFYYCSLSLGYEDGCQFICPEDKRHITVRFTGHSRILGP